MRKPVRCSNCLPNKKIALPTCAVSQTKQVSLLFTILILGWVIVACAREESAPTLAPGENTSTVERVVSETATAAPLTSAAPPPAASPVPLSQAPTQIQTQSGVDDSKVECAAPTTGESTKQLEDLRNEHAFGPPPDTYVLKVQVETSSLWTSVEVTGVESVTSNYTIIQGDGEINVHIEGVKVHEISRPEGRQYQQNVILEIDAIVQKQDDTAEFQVRKERSGMTVYKLFSGGGDSTQEIARFTNDTTNDGDNLRTFFLDLDAFPPPISFPIAQERYKGPLFDAHVHLVGPKDHDHTETRYHRLHINPKTAESFFATLDRENVVGLFGFLPIIHEYFDGDDSYNRSYQEQTLSVVNRCDNKLIPFLTPNTHIGVTPNEHGYKLPTLIDQNYRGNPIPFRGIGEIHTGGILTDSYAGMRLIDPAMLELIDYAAANNLVLMIHPELSDIQDVHRAIMHNPDTIFLLHGLVNNFDRGRIADELGILFREYKNVYFSVDATLMAGYSLLDDRIRTKEKFLANLLSNETYYRLLASALVFWKPIIEAHPTRLMWGSDLAYWWHYEPDVIHEIAQFGRDFTSGLDPEVQERFAYRNAADMLGLPQD